MRFIAIYLLLLCGIASAQVTSTVDSVFVVQGIDGYRIVADMVVVDEASKPSLKQVGLVDVEYDAAIIRVKAEDAKRKPVETKQVEPGKFLILGNGQIWIRITCVDFDRKIFEDATETIVIGADPIPDPEPDEPVDPSAESPFAGDGIRVLIVYELDDIQAYPPSKVATMYGKTIRTWAINNCVKDASGTAELRIFDKDITGQNETWSKALTRKRTELPWLVIGNGKTGYEGPLPATEAETIQLLESFK